jgi:hypothetical protein
MRRRVEDDLGRRALLDEVESAVLDLHHALRALDVDVQLGAELRGADQELDAVEAVEGLGELVAVPAAGGLVGLDDGLERRGAGDEAAHGGALAVLRLVLVGELVHRGVGVVARDRGVGHDVVVGETRDRVEPEGAVHAEARHDRSGDAAVAQVLRDLGAARAVAAVEDDVGRRARDDLRHGLGDAVALHVVVARDLGAAQLEEAGAGDLALVLRVLDRGVGEEHRVLPVAVEGELAHDARLAGGAVAHREADLEAAFGAVDRIADAGGDVQDVVLLGDEGRGGGDVVVAGDDDDLGAVVDGLLRERGVLLEVGAGVVHLEFDLLAVDAAGLVQLVDGDAHRVQGGGVEGRHEAGLGDDGADDDGVAVARGLVPAATAGVRGDAAGERERARGERREGDAV